MKQKIYQYGLPFLFLMLNGPAYLGAQVHSAPPNLIAALIIKLAAFEINMAANHHLTI